MSQETSIKRDSSTTVRSRMSLEFNKSLPLEQEISLHLPCSRDLEATGHQSLFISLLFWWLAVYSFSYLCDIWWTGVTPFTITTLRNTNFQITHLDNKERQKGSQPKSSTNYTWRFIWKLFNPFPTFPMLQSPFTNVSFGNMLAVLIFDLGCQWRQNSQKSFPKIHLA